MKQEISEIQTQESDDNDDWLCVDAPNLDDYLEMYSRGDVSSTYDFSIISNAFKKFLEVPATKKDLLDGADFKSLNKVNEQIDEELVDFNIDTIEKNLNELLDFKSKPKKAAPENYDEDLDSIDDENDSFYEIDDDILEESENNQKLEYNLQNYMCSMDEELKSQSNLTRFDNKNNDELELDLNLVSNALESYSSQLGLTGPVSNILKSLGI